MTNLPRPIFSFQKDQWICETFPTGRLGCNTSFLYDHRTKEALLIDPGNDPQLIEKLIQDRGWIIKDVVHTHAHFDHIGATPLLAQRFDWKVWLHQKDLFLYNALPEQGFFFGEKVAAPIPLTTFLENEQTFTVKGHSNPLLQTIHSPGHTPGSCCFLTECLEFPILFSGDTLFQHSIGRTDLPGGDSSLITSSIKALYQDLDGETICIPGHGPLTSIKEEKRSNPFVKGL
jgi:hydroxyacylglutathione hydrolase